MSDKKSLITKGHPVSDFIDEAFELAKLTPMFMENAATGNFQAAVVAMSSSYAGIKLKKLFDEIQERRASGKLNKTLEEICTEEQSSILELLKFLSKELPDETRWKAMQALFFANISSDTEQKYLSLLLFDVGKKLSRLEFLVLKSMYSITEKDFVNTNPQLTYVQVGLWQEIIAKKNNIPSYLVISCQSNLFDYGLIEIVGDKTLIMKKNGGLSDLGFQLCKAIINYE